MWTPLRRRLKWPVNQSIYTANGKETNLYNNSREMNNPQRQSCILEKVEMVWFKFVILSMYLFVFFISMSCTS